MDESNALENLVRIGTVTAVDKDKRIAHVKFDDKDGLISDWLEIGRAHV